MSTHTGHLKLFHKNKKAPGCLFVDMTWWRHQWKHCPRYWPFVRWIHRTPANSPHKGQCRRALRFSLICVWINGWVNNREAGDLRRYRAHHDVIVMIMSLVINWHEVLIGPLRFIHYHVVESYLYKTPDVSNWNNLPISGKLDCMLFKSILIDWNSIIAAGGVLNSPVWRQMTGWYYHDILND